MGAMGAVHWLPGVCSGFVVGGCGTFPSSWMSRGTVIQSLKSRSLASECSSEAGRSEGDGWGFSPVEGGLSSSSVRSSSLGEEVFSSSSARFSSAFAFLRSRCPRLSLFFLEGCSSFSASFDASGSSRTECDRFPREKFLWLLGVTFVEPCRSRWMRCVESKVGAYGLIWLNDIR